MAKKDISSITTRVYGLLKPLESEDRQRVVAAALTLLGERARQETSDDRTSEETGTAQAYFKSKQPQTKIEELAVAARFRELQQDQQDQQVHKKSDLQAVFKAARRNFDSHKFSFDIANAKKAGLFTRAREITLAHYGVSYVDALPDREAVKRLRRPKGTARKRKAARKKKQ